MNNYDGNKKGYNNRNNNGKFNKRGNSNNAAANNAKAERDAKRAEILAKQTKNLEMIAAVAEFLDDQLRNTDPENANAKISMQKVIDFLTTSKGYAQDDTKSISQFNYLIVDLANAQKSTYIDGNRINIRILYIQERMKTSFKKNLYDTIDDIINKYNTLFYWNPADENAAESGIEIVVNDEKPAAEEVVEGNDQAPTTEE